MDEWMVGRKDGKMLMDSWMNEKLNEWKVG